MAIAPAQRSIAAKEDVQISNIRPSSRAGGARTSDRGRSCRDCCDQGSAYRGTNHRRLCEAAYICAVQRQIRLRKQRDQANRTDQFERDTTFILGSGGVDSEEGEIPPITIDHGGRRIGEIIAAAMRTVRQKRD